MLFHNFGRIVNLVSLEPLPKQGCETEERETMSYDSSLSGTPAEAGVRVVYDAGMMLSSPGLSGTPTEAGVRGAGTRNNAP